MLLKNILVFSVLFLLSYAQVNYNGPLNKKEEDAEEFLQELDKSYSTQCNLNTESRWRYSTDLDNEAAKTKAKKSTIQYLEFKSEAASNASGFDYETFDFDLYRQFRFQKDQGLAGLEKEDFDRYIEIESNTFNTFNKVSICPSNETSNNCSTTSLSDLEKIMGKSTDFEELKHVWEQWREKTGKRLKENYLELVSLSNDSALNDGYENTGEFWLNSYTVTEKEAKTDRSLSPIDQNQFRESIETIWEEVFEKLYQPLHAFVRMKMLELYDGQYSINDTLPANILGSMWADDWSNIREHVKPFPEEPDYDVTVTMIENNWTIDQMYIEAENFFVEMGMMKMSQVFWNMSVIDQEAWGKKMICRASAEDFCLGKDSFDFRMRMCTQVNMEDLVTVHSKMALIEYFMAYTNRPRVYRSGANPGFLDAVGGLIGLSVSSPYYMEQIFKSKSEEPQSRTTADKYYDSDINYLMDLALKKIPALSFAYVLDKYQMDIFSGSITNQTLNTAWWHMREDIQGLKAPSEHLRGNDFFDAGAHYNVAANIPSISTFVSIILEFQFLEHLCKLNGVNDNLLKCDLQNTDVGAVLRESMELGFSQPWPIVLQKLGGTTSMSANSIIKYFEPLIKHITEQLKKHNVNIQWNSALDSTIEDLTKEMKNMNDNITEYAVSSVDASWQYNTDINEENANAKNEASVKFSTNYYQWWENLISHSSSDYIEDEFVNRQFQLQKSIGLSILNDTALSRLNELLNNMVESYGNKVCPFHDMKCEAESDGGYDINQLEVLMATRTKYSELLYYWEKWRDVSGKQMIHDFPEYVNNMNDAARQNNFKDAGSLWIDPYTTYGSDEYTEQDFKSDIATLWEEMFPLYKMLHAYVREKLKGDKEYGKYFEEDGLIPAHILGNMWAQSWENIYEKVAPFPEVPLINITSSLKEMNSTTEMFEMAENFFTGIGLYPMTDDFWENSMLERPDDGREAVCHASAWDFYSTETDNTKDGRFRIKMCTNLNQEDFLVIHHEMGHIEYQMAYSNDMPIVFRDGANPGFHEAIGDTIALSVSNPSHLEKYFPQTRKESYGDKEKQKINFLFKEALAKVAFLPYAYILDQFRWEVFNGSITPDNYNEKWWAKRIDFQGLRPPISRSPSSDFDVGSKYHVPANVPYIRYFVSHILQFQFHEQLCKEANIEPPYFNCDIDSHPEAGRALKKMLKKGSSVQWQRQLEGFLGLPNATMSSAAINDYFSDLWVFLNETLDAQGIEPGWWSSDKALDAYMDDLEHIPATVPIVIGIVLVVLVSIVLVAFFVGQNKRKKMEKKRNEAKQRVGEHINEGLEMDENV